MPDADPITPSAPRGLKLFVWPEHQRDYTAGVAFALAHDEAEARRLIREHPDNYEEPSGEPIVTDQPFGYSRAGGG